MSKVNNNERIGNKGITDKRNSEWQGSEDNDEE